MMHREGRGRKRRFGLQRIHERLHDIHRHHPKHGMSRDSYNWHHACRFCTSEDAEEVLEFLWIEEVEKGKEVSDPGTIIHENHRVHPGTIPELMKNGLVEMKGIDGGSETVVLTGNGKSAARSVVRRHRLAERLFHDVLHMHGEDMEGPACRLEHALSPEAEESICTLLGHPPECPHGRPIPEGRCCVEGRKEAARLVFNAAELRKGQGGRISFLNTRDEGRLQKLIAMGILPGMDVEVLAHYPTHVLKIGESQFALDEDMASHIFVRITEIRDEEEGGS